MDREWPNYQYGDEKMLSLVDPNMMVKGHPKCRALRKLINDVVGPICSDSTDIKHFIVYEGAVYSAVESHIQATILNPNLFGESRVGDVAAGSAAADGIPINLSGKFQKYPTANADTRAKSRAYISLLGLNIVAAEEIDGDDDISQVVHEDPVATNIERLSMNAVFDKFKETHGKALDPNAVTKYLGFDYNKLTKKQIMSTNSAVQGWTRSVKSLPKDLQGVK